MASEREAVFCVSGVIAAQPKSLGELIPSTLQLLELRVTDGWFGLQPLADWQKECSQTNSAPTCFADVSRKVMKRSSVSVDGRSRVVLIWPCLHDRMLIWDTPALKNYWERASFEVNQHVIQTFLTSLHRRRL